MEEDQQPIQIPEQNIGITSPPGASKQRARKKPFQWKNLGSNGLFVLFGLIVIVLVYSFVDRVFIDPPVSAETNRGGKSHTIQLDVLNGSGTPRLGQRFTDYLRARGFDVVEMGNYKESGIELTRVIDRAGDLAAARQVAEALGVPKERVIQQVDKNVYLDVSVVIGKDFKSLKPLK
jgi:hypothetical protein